MVGDDEERDTAIVEGCSEAIGMGLLAEEVIEIVAWRAKQGTGQGPGIQEDIDVLVLRGLQSRCCCASSCTNTRPQVPNESTCHALHEHFCD